MQPIPKELRWCSHVLHQRVTRHGNGFSGWKVKPALPIEDVGYFVAISGHINSYYNPKISSDGLLGGYDPAASVNVPSDVNNVSLYSFSLEI